MREKSTIERVAWTVIPALALLLMAQTWPFGNQYFPNGASIVMPAAGGGLNITSVDGGTIAVTNGLSIGGGSSIGYVARHSCSMSSASSCQWTDTTLSSATAYISCVPVGDGTSGATANLFDGWSVSGTTWTIYAYVANTAVWQCLAIN